MHPLAAQEFPRIAQPGELLGLINSTGIKQGSAGMPIFHRVEFIEQVPQIDLDGTIDLGATTSADIATGETDQLQMPSNELLQARFVIATSGAAVAANSTIEVTMAQLAASNRFVTKRNQARWTVLQQGFLPRTDLSPTIGSRVIAATEPAIFSLAKFWQTEHYIFEDDVPTYTLTNPTATALGGSCTPQLVVIGWRYILSIAAPEANWADTPIFGKMVKAPPRFTRVGITGVGR